MELLRSKLLYLLLFSLNFNSVYTVSKGYDFADNLMNVRMGPDNGFLRAEMGGLIPPKLSICARMYTANIRHGNQLGVWSIYTPHNDRVPVFDLQCRGENYCLTEYHGLVIPRTYEYPRVNMIRKWSSMCIGLDFTADSVRSFYNGKEVNEDLEVSRKESGYQALDVRLPKGYFSGLNLKHMYMIFFNLFSI